MNEFEIIEGPGDSVVEDIEIDGESFHIEEFEPTLEEYRELIGGVYKSFYDEDMRCAIEKAIEEKMCEMRAEMNAEVKGKEEALRNQIKGEILNKIAKRRMRPDENGISVQRAVAKRDVSKMTKEERAEAARKAAGGIIINLK